MWSGKLCEIYGRIWCWCLRVYSYLTELRWVGIFIGPCIIDNSLNFGMKFFPRILIIKFYGQIIYNWLPYLYWILFNVSYIRGIWFHCLPYFWYLNFWIWIQIINISQIAFPIVNQMASKVIIWFYRFCLWSPWKISIIIVIIWRILTSVWRWS